MRTKSYSRDVVKPGVLLFFLICADSNLFSPRTPKTVANLIEMYFPIEIYAAKY